MLQENLAKVQAKVQEALANRKEKKATGDKVTILAVTKNHPPEIVTEALAAGLTDVGENRVQEAMHKQEVLPPGGVWHLIGHLQTNKAKHAVEHFAIIESVDSEKIMQHLDKEAAALGKVQDVLLQINEAGEEQKSGFAPEKVLPAAEAALERTHVRVRGLMTIPPADAQRDANFRYFQEVQALYVDMNQKLFHNELEYLSMGMSGDYEDAIRAGATMVRVGSAIFGARHYN